MVVAMHEPLDDKIGMKVKIDHRHHQRRIMPAPAWLPFHFAHGGTQKTAELFWNMVEHGQEMLVLELDHVNVHQQPILGVVIDHGAHGRGKQPQSFAGKRILQGLEDALQEHAHGVAIALPPARQRSGSLLG